MSWLRRTGLVGMIVGAGAVGRAQDYSVLRINEVIAENHTQTPTDVGGAKTDMVELYNSGTEILVLGSSTLDTSLALTDSTELPPNPGPWTFPSGVTILPGKFVIIFCDGDTATQGDCELHSGFNIANDGSEPITLWGPVVGVVDGKSVRQIIDQVWLPPLSADVSFGRYPDGTGPAPVPIEDVLSVFNFYPSGTSSFGNICSEIDKPCAASTKKKRFCAGAPNPSRGGNLAPHISIETHSTNNPDAGEPVVFRVKVSDEKGPTGPNIARVEIVYQVDGGTSTSVDMVYDSTAGVQQGVIPDCDGSLPGTEPCPNPFDLWTFWDGEIPGQSAGAIVEFFVRVVDAQGASESSPQVLCAAGVGPCDADFGGPGCAQDPESESCNPPIEGAKYFACRKPFRYKVAATPRPELATVVVNEVVPQQDGVLKDVTEKACDTDDACPPSKPDCCKLREDFIELYNSSPTQTVDLSGLWLSDGAFHPQIWQFPAGSKILPLEHLIVWCDNDGGKCPDETVCPPNAEENDPYYCKPCFWECPDPTDPAIQEYHTNFALDTGGDQIYLFDDEAHDFAVVHGVDFGRRALNSSLALVPDGDRNGCFIDAEMPTPRDPNQGTCPSAAFRRGDSNFDCRVDISDATYTLNFLFAGGGSPACLDGADANDTGRVDISDAIYTLGYLFLSSAGPPAPGPDVPGPDPTADDLPDCASTSC